MAIGQRKVTLEEFLRWPEQEPPLEYFDGVVSQKLPPNYPHGALAAVSAELINQFARPRRLGQAVVEVRAATDAGSSVPDVSFYALERLQRDPRGVPLPYQASPPDLLVEIASPGQTRSTLEERCRWLVEHGVPLALLIWPVNETVSVFRPGEAMTVLRGSDRIPFGEILAELELTVQELFDTAYWR
jgi:Uma2 family endonuclease